jgi:hypothetical protein
MNPADLEKTYEMLAQHIDQFDETVAPVYLAKVALLMAAEIDDVEVVRQCIVAAAEALDH